MKMKHILTLTLSMGLFGVNLLAGDAAMCGGASPASNGTVQPKGKSAVQRSAEELVARVAPERQSDLLILLNEATEDGLLKINGVAATKAAAIVKARPIGSLSDLVEVKGIGVTTLARILSYDPNAVPEPSPETGTGATPESMGKQQS
jgi:DNA uptake protein ComE-like DNA-binding protein